MNNVFLRGLVAFVISVNMICGQNLALASGDMDLTPQISSDAEGFDSTTGAYSLRKKVDVKNSDILTEITTLSAVGFGIEAFPLVCSQVNDIYPYVGGAVAYLTMMIIANQKLKKANEELSQEITQLSGDKKSDVTALEKLKSAEENRLKATQLKMAATATLTAAFIVSEILVLALISEITIAMGLMASPYTAASGLAMYTSLMSLGTCFGGYTGEFTGQWGLVAQFVIGMISQGAGAGSLGGIISLAMMIFNGSVQNIVRNPNSRAIYYGAAIGISGAGTVITGVKKGQVKKNIKDIDKMITSYKTNTRPTSISTGDLTNGDWNAYFQEISVSGNANAGLDSGAANALKSLGKIDIKNIKLPTNIKSPTLANSVAGLNNINKAMKSGQYGKAVAFAGDLSKNLAKLKKVSEGLKLKVNEQLKKAGKAPIDFAGKSNSLAEKLNNSSGQAIQQSGAQNSLSKPEAQTKEESNTAGGSQNAAEVVAAVAPIQVEEELFQESGFNEDTIEIASATPQQNLNDYVVNKKDIHNDRSKSIFGLLSVRYLKTAYPQLLEEAK